MMLLSSFSSWITNLLACIGSCFSCCTKSRPIISEDDPSKRLRSRGRVVKKPSISDDFWSTSARDMDNSAFPSQRSYSSISASNQSLINGPSSSSSSHPDFINHGFLCWNQSRLQWVGSGKSQSRENAPEPVLCWNASYEGVLGTSKRFAQPVPLSEMVDFLVDVWERDGLYN